MIVAEVEFDDGTVLRNTLSATPNVASVKTQVTIRPTKREAGVPLEVARPAR